MMFVRIIALICLFCLEFLFLTGLLGALPLMAFEDALAASRILSTYREPFAIVRDSFLEVKTTAAAVEALKHKADYGFMLLEEIKKKHGLDVRIYDVAGNRVLLPGELLENDDERIYTLLRDSSVQEVFEYKERSLFVAWPLVAEKRCTLCHSRWKKDKVYGVISFTKAGLAVQSYLFVRRLFFAVLSFLTFVLIILLLVYDPFRRIKELFDKS